MTYDDRFQPYPDKHCDPFASASLRDAAGISEVDFDFDLETSCSACKFPDIALPPTPLADVDLFGTSTAKPVTPPKLSSPMPEVLPCRMTVKSYVDGRPHSGELGDEARRLYDAMSFKALRDGWGFNTFVTVTAQYLGFESHAEFAAMIPAMNKAMAGWLKASPKRSARFYQDESSNHSYIYVLERSGFRHGLHFHMMCTVPVKLRKEFRCFLADWWERQACLAVPSNAVDVKYSQSGGRDRQFDNQAIKFRYMIKTVREDVYTYDKEGRKRLAAEFMKPWRPNGVRPDILPIRTRQIYGISRDLDVKARRDWAEEVGWFFVSKLGQGRLDELYSGSEISAWHARFIGAPHWWKSY